MLARYLFILELKFNIEINVIHENLAGGERAVSIIVEVTLLSVFSVSAGDTDGEVVWKCRLDESISQCTENEI